MADTTERYHKTYPISWEQLQRDCRALAWKLLDIRTDWNRLIAVARGGLAPAAIIARELNIKMVDTVCVSSYTIRNQGEMSVLKRPDLAGVDGLATRRGPRDEPAPPRRGGASAVTADRRNAHAGLLHPPDDGEP